MNNESRAQLIDRLVPGLAAFGGTSAWVENNGVRLHSLIFGNGPIDIVVLPGITRPAPTWAFVAKWLIDLARVVVRDVRGRGLSDAPPAGTNSPTMLRTRAFSATRWRLTVPSFSAIQWGRGSTP